MLTWNRAESWCIRNIPNGHLISINSAQEMKFIEKAIRNMKSYIINKRRQKYGLDYDEDPDLFVDIIGYLNYFKQLAPSKRSLETEQFIDKACTTYIGLQVDVQVRISSIATTIT